MDKKLEYIFSLVDRMSAPMKRIGVTSDHTLDVLSNLEKQTLLVKKNFSSFGDSITSLRSKLDLLRAERDLINPKNIADIRAYNREIHGLEKRINNLSNVGSGKNMFSEAMNQLPLGGLITNPFVLAGAAAAKAISVGIQNENIAAAFSTMLGDQAGKKMDKAITDFGKTSPYEKMNLAENAKMMLGFGVAQEKVIPSMKMLGDVAMGNQEKLDSLTLAFSQIQAAGKMQGQDLLQLVNAGFNPLQEISKMTGKSMGELRDDMSKGKISADMITAAFQAATGEGGKFHGMADKMGQTLGGRLSTLMDNITESFVKMYNIIGPILTPAVNILIVGFEYVNSFFQRWMDAFNAGNPIITAISGALIGMAGAMAVVGLYYGALALKTMLLNGVTAILNSTLLANPYVQIALGIGVLIGAVVMLWNKFEGFRKFIYGLHASIKQVFTNIGDTIAKIFEPVGEIIDAFKSGDWARLAKASGKLLFNLSPAGLALNASGLGKGVSDAYDKGSKLGIRTKSTAANVGIGPAPISNLPTVAELNSNSNKSDSSATSAGTKSTSITIHIGSLINELKLMPQSIADMEKEIEDAVISALARSLTTAQSQLGAE